MTLTIDMAVLLVVILYFLVRRRPLARSRSDQAMVVALAVVVGVLVAPTAFGQGVLDVMGDVAQGVSQPGNP